MWVSNDPQVETSDPNITIYVIWTNTVANPLIQNRNVPETRAIYLLRVSIVETASVKQVFKRDSNY